MSWLPTADADTDLKCPDGVEMVILPRASDIGGFEVRRALPFRSKRMVGPFIFWNFVSSSKERLAQAKEDWRNRQFPIIPSDADDFVPLPDE